MDISKLGKGCIQDILDERDLKLEEILGAATPFDWDKGFDIEEELGHKLKVENQGKSSSCVGQAWSNYLQVIDWYDSGNVTDLSAKDIYSRIFQPQGGASLRDGAKLAVNRGISLEKSNPSYMNGLPPAEEFMRIVVDGLETEAQIYSAKSYATMTHNSFDFMAGYMKKTHGFVSGVLGDNEGWRIGKDGIVSPPKSIDWGHALYFGKAKLINGEKMLGFLNSWSNGWGDNGWGWVKVNYLTPVNGYNIFFNLWSLIDNKLIKKPMTNVKLIKKGDEIAFYLPATNQESLKAMAKFYGIEIPLREDGVSVDWSKLKIDYKLT